MARNRQTMPKNVELVVLTRSKRRCCLCFELNADSSEKPGQIAHLDRKPSNNSESNLAYRVYFIMSSLIPKQALLRVSVWSS